MLSTSKTPEFFPSVGETLVRRWTDCDAPKTGQLEVRFAPLSRETGLVRVVSGKAWWTVIPNRGQIELPGLESKVACSQVFLTNRRP